MISDRRILRSSSIVEIRSRIYFSLSLPPPNFISRFQELLEFDIRRGIEKFTFFFSLSLFVYTNRIRESRHRRRRRRRMAIGLISFPWIPQETLSERDSIIRVLVFFLFHFATLKRALE